jgi:hypothetical protein
MYGSHECGVGGGGPTSPLDGIVEELDRLFYVFSILEEDVDRVVRVSFILSHV